MRIEDIARLAGVSSATVSRVLNGGRVTDATKKRVEEIVRREGYTPNYYARSLMTQRSNTIGLFVTSMSNSYYMEMAEEIERKVRERHFMLLICSTNGSDSQERSYVDAFASRRVDAVIGVDCELKNHESGFYRRIQKTTPVVFVHSYEELKDAPGVFIDQTTGMLEVMEYVRGLGYDRMAFMRGKEGYTYDVKEKAWRGRIARLGLPEPDKDLITVEHGNVEDAMTEAEDAFTAYLSSGGDAKVVFACNDLMARGIMTAAERAGLRIPQDLAVVSHDNTILARTGKVRLSSVDMRVREVGDLAAGLCLDIISGEAPRTVSLVPHLVVRDSSRK